MELKINESLKLNLDIPLSRVVDFNMQWRVNDHASLKLRGELPYEVAIGCQSKLLSGSKIVVEYCWDQRVQVIFNGLIKKIEISYEGSIAQMQIEGISATWKMDITRSCRSFQDGNMTYAELAKRVAGYTETDVIAVVGKNTKISEPLLQYQESDWEFMKRVCSHLNKFILCDVLTGNPAFWFGMRKGGRIALTTDHSYHCTIDPILKRKKYIVCSREAYQIGDRATFLEEDVVILQRDVEFNGETIFTYTLGSETVLDQNIQYNDNLSGCGLWGIVKEISGEMLKIQLEIDKDEDCGEYWFPWYPETGNIMCAMPEIGSLVLLSISGNDESSAVVSVCLHNENKKDEHYSNRYLKISDHSLFKLSPDKLEFSKNEGSQAVALEDGTINIKTDKKIKIEAEKNIYVKGRSVIIKASEEINGVVG